MAIVSVTHDVAQDFDVDVPAAANLQCSVSGFHVYVRVIRNSVIFADYKVINGAAAILIAVLLHDRVRIQVPCGTGNMTVNRL